MRLWRFLTLLWLLGPLHAWAAVDASDYDAFWLWGGVTSQPVLAKAKTLYVLQGQISTSRRDPQQRVNFIAQGMAVTRLPQEQLWVVYRAHTLRWPEPVYRQLLGQVERWRQAGNTLVGIQIDFDARTRYLNEYVDFLRDLRRRLPPEYRLSITGLMDWSSNADARFIGDLKGVIDEVVVQTYQGRHSIPDYAAYLPRLNRLGLPFKIGLIQGGEWQAPGYLQDNEWFRGYVVFLQNR
ncbi:hypothetical protein PSCICO_51440 [Pseudomonas cichorii]|uniref:DUF3142 domain-containing protein n=2 Tax=Pseudomonas syringae group TaxID=136849 RepID=A0A3M4W0C2_PSECI|nr:MULTISPECIES: DUF3142 domain-containing protein [Pseudomonas]AHF66889.1 protein of unknown function (DUF3142) [Pseudomonas cichorii JBC1]MDO7930369.1 DUF3142 domain-containing protein [Pseudomonas sp. KFB-138]QVE18785.1 DUF3142 domain-containing protein [Pseudomonas cichorii]RMR57297.1 hypothetical protein ALP84_03910 [Pseudomonas cichorii]SDN46692.1 Protein of unknown function [Pseudomonas cichorii]